ncbi:glycosyltransferase [Polycladidibacter hongkongensis]|uniref:glycosyltransferase n=1 Tax=Polycladidibacter hongkongensis TaxID=1647556 RepID=UPI000832CDD1|nr:glycosyltransferase [Pseudovibrio hongkongensis]
MLLVDILAQPDKTLTNELLSLSQLRAAGYNPSVSYEATEPLLQAQAYGLSKYKEPGEEAANTLIVLNANHLADDRAERIRNLKLCDNADVLLSAPDLDVNSHISLKNKYAIITGRTVSYLPSVTAGEAKHCATVSCGAPLNNLSNTKVPLCVLSPNISEDNQIWALQALSIDKQFDLRIITTGEGKQRLRGLLGNAPKIFHYSELSAVDLSCAQGILVVGQAPKKNSIAQAILMNSFVNGSVTINCSNAQLPPIDSAAVVGPHDLVHLPGYLQTSILPSLQILQEKSRQAIKPHLHSLQNVLAPMLGEPERSRAEDTSRTGEKKILFVPTNGVGLGHAQRCSIVASELHQQSMVNFAAFPSCIPMLTRYGFDTVPLVSRSAQLATPYANDLVNYHRIAANLNKGDTLVFDGGYVFDSIYRNIYEKQLHAIWIRRGLWQNTQNNSVALDREKAFNKVIVPLEALDALNQTISTGDHVYEVGPIAQHLELDVSQQQQIRARLAQQFQTPFRKLVVSMLGGGVAADRSAQLNTLCSYFEQQNDILHLVVIWPTAQVNPALYTWQNTKIVKTHHALPLIKSCDLLVSAVGYNTFHDVLYNAIPTLFVPQMASFMDDQAARATTASEAGLALDVEPTDFESLTYKIDEGLCPQTQASLTSALQSFNLPERGNQAAAEIISGAHNEHQ